MTTHEAHIFLHLFLNVVQTTKQTIPALGTCPGTPVLTQQFELKHVLTKLQGNNFEQVISL